MQTIGHGADSFAADGTWMRNANTELECGVRCEQEQSWRTALQSGLREVVELSEEVWDTAKGNEEAVRRAKDKTNAAIVESCAALDEVEAAVELLARAPRFPSPSRADLARAELTRSRSNSPVKTPRTPGRPAVNDSFGEVWECLADVLDRVPIHFPGLIGQLIREHLEVTVSCSVHDALCGALALHG